MKQANNNEVDLLLRSFAKGRESSALRSALYAGDGIDGGNGGAEDHLDADELNSYAEGVVPAPARARYMEHLAECDSCRRVVIDLSQAAGAANRFDVPAEQKGAGFWQTLTAFFSPAVLRYAVPVLVLTSVVGIGFLALLRERGQDFVARNEQAPALSQQQSKSVETPAGNTTAPQSAPTGSGAPTVAGTPTVGGLFGDNASRGQPAPADRPAPVSSTDDVTKVGSVATTVAKDGIAPGKTAEGVDESRPTNAAEPKAAAPAPPPTVNFEYDRAELAKERARKAEDRDRQAEVSQTESNYRTQPVEEHGPNRSAAPRSAGRADVGSGASLPAKRGPNATDKKGDYKAKAANAETRSVSGRHFTRANNVWVDDAYEDGQATVKVSRSSEQFRALVADESGLRKIANELSGTVIVVWKNRAYRIQ